jgi:hypothetical protein
MKYFKIFYYSLDSKLHSNLKNSQIIGIQILVGPRHFSHLHSIQTDSVTLSCQPRNSLRT